MILLPHSRAKYHRVDDQSRIEVLPESIVLFHQHIGDGEEYEFGAPKPNVSQSYETPFRARQRQLHHIRET